MLKRLTQSKWIVIASNIILLVSCNQQQYSTFITGGGETTAKLGDTIITFQDTINSIGSNLDLENTIIFGNYSRIPNYSFSISIYSNPGFAGTYKLVDEYSNHVQGLGGAAKNGYYYFTDSTHSGIFTINSYNQAFQIMSGTFHFTAVLYDSVGHRYPADTIVVSDGNFVAHIYLYTIPIQ